MTDEQSIQIREFEADEIGTALDASDVEAESSLDNLDPLTATIIVGGGLALGKFLIRLVNEIRGGTVIDLTQTPVDVRRDNDLNYLFFMVIAKDGTVTVDGKDEPEEGLERMVESVLKLATSATVDTAKAAIEAATSDKAKVEPAT